MTNLKNLIDNYPNIEFIIFSTPVSHEHFDALLANNLYDDYEKWLRESVEVFGKINHFMYINELTKNTMTYFQDSNHAFNFTNKCLVDEINNLDSICPKVKMLIDKDNIENQLIALKKLNLKTKLN